MNSIEADLPFRMLAGNVAVAALAAVGALFILPVPVSPEASFVAVPILTLAFGAGLVVAGRGVAHRAREHALDNAAVDPETGLSTHDHAQRVLSREFAAAQRGRPLTIVLFRIKGVPGYASRHGRAVADQLMRSTGRTIASYRRRMHLAALFGSAPGTYLAVLSGMEIEGASIYASRVRRAVMTQKGLPEAPALSAGIASYDVSMRSSRDLIEQARRALDKGDRAGGKVVVVGRPSRTQDAGAHQYF